MLANCWPSDKVPTVYLHQAPFTFRMCPQQEPVENFGPPSRSRRRTKLYRAIAGTAMLVALWAIAETTLRRLPTMASSAGVDSHVSPSTGGAWRGLSSRDGLGAYPETARLQNGQDRENFVRWFAFLAETQYYAPSPRARLEIQDCAALVRFAFRNSLVAHSPAWREQARLPFDPGFGDVAAYLSPSGPSERALFRTEPPCGSDAPSPQTSPCSSGGPPTDSAVSAGPAQGAFGEFADSATLLRYNTYLISRDLRAARPGDLLFFHQSVQHEPFHTMVFVGKSYFQTQGSDWVVYHTGDLDGSRGQIREVQAKTLLEHPDLRWRPLLNNPHFLGVFRLEILR